MSWWWIAMAIGAGYALKLAGMLAPERVVQNRTVRSVTDLLPVALLGALIAVSTLTSGHRVVLDARLVGLAAAVVALLLRAPFLVVVVVAAVVTALCRLLW